MKALKASRQTKLKLKNGFHKAPISYRVLMVAQFTAADQKDIAKGLLKATTPDKAKELLPGPGKPSKWSLIQETSVGLIGRYELAMLRYKGLEVAVFWRRQTSEVIPAPSDPVPEGVLENPDDVWARLDLFSKSPRQLVGIVADDIKRLEAEVLTKDTQIEAQQRIIVADDKTIATLQGKITALEAKLNKKK